MSSVLSPSFSDSVSAVPACAVSAGFSDTGNSPSAAGAAGTAGAATFAAMNCSSLLVKAWCTRRDKPGPKYNLGIICNSTWRSIYCPSRLQLNHFMPSTNPLLFILRCVTHTLTDDSYFRQRSHSILPQDACRTSWQVICDRPNFNVSDKTKIMQTCGKMQTQSKSNCQCMHNSSQNCKTGHSGFRAHETHRRVM